MMAKLVEEWAMIELGFRVVRGRPLLAIEEIGGRCRERQTDRRGRGAPEVAQQGIR
jgi:hypothetical protein